MGAGRGQKACISSSLVISLCKSKVVGGLGICIMEDTKKALMAKVSYNTLIREDKP